MALVGYRFGFVEGYGIFAFLIESVAVSTPPTVVEAPASTRLIDGLSTTHPYEDLG